MLWKLFFLKVLLNCYNNSGLVNIQDFFQECIYSKLFTRTICVSHQYWSLPESKKLEFVVFYVTKYLKNLTLFGAFLSLAWINPKLCYFWMNISILRVRRGNGDVTGLMLGVGCLSLSTVAIWFPSGPPFNFPCSAQVDINLHKSQVIFPKASLN